MKTAALAASVAVAMWTSSAIAQPTAELPASLRGPATVQKSGVVERESLPLGASEASRASDSAGAGGVQPIDSTSSYVQTVVALAAVLGLIAVVAAIVKYASKRSGGVFAALTPTVKAPQGVLEVLARYPVASGTQLLVLKFDRRVLLLSQTNNKGWRSGATMATLCELSDPADVASILIKTRGEEQASLAAKFQKMLASEDAEFAEPRETNPYAMRAQTRSPQASKPRLDIVAGDDVRSSGQETAAAIRQRLAAMQSKPRRAGGVA
ncbi:MAG TPA: hypothetical protein VK157_03950 [Phycisphaerales bacterium]|nr:hypothetical protein [Phycisphaerales bacterium]